MSHGAVASGPAKYSPAQLARMLGAQEPTAEQAAVIGAPLAPLAVIAGAGSGKSETMAARLVWLVANQLVRPERVLGLTFTRKAAAELAERVRTRLAGLRRAGLLVPGTPGPSALLGADLAAGGVRGADALLRSGQSDEEDLLAGDPVISTYHAYAGRLVGDHALREGLEPTLRLITPAVSWQLAARVVAAYEGPADALEWTPATVTAAVLTLAGEMAEHLRGPEDVLATGALAGEVAGQPDRPRAEGSDRRAQAPADQRAAAAAGRRLCRRQGGTGRSSTIGDQMALAARIASRHPVVGLSLSGPATRWSCWMNIRTHRMLSSCCSGRCSAAGIR